MPGSAGSDVASTTESKRGGNIAARRFGDLGNELRIKAKQPRGDWAGSEASLDVGKHRMGVQ